MKTRPRLTLGALVVAAVASLWVVFHPPIEGYYIASFIPSLPSSQLRFLDGEVFAYYEGEPKRLGTYTQSSSGKIVWTWKGHRCLVKRGWLFLKLNFQPTNFGEEPDVKKEIRDLRFWRNPASKPPADTPEF